MGKNFRNPWAKGGENFPDWRADFQENILNKENQNPQKSFTPPGQVQFNSNQSINLNDFAIINEEGGLIRTIKFGKLYNGVDGLWFKGKKDAWLKIPNDCICTIKDQTSNNLEFASYQGFFATVLGVNTHWEYNEKANTENPFK